MSSADLICLVLATVPLLCHTRGLRAQPSNPTRYVIVVVDGGKEAWTTTGLEVEATDLILVRAMGTVHAGAFTGSVDASTTTTPAPSPSTPSSFPRVRFRRR